MVQSETVESERIILLVSLLMTGILSIINGRVSSIFLCTCTVPIAQEYSIHSPVYVRMNSKDHSSNNQFYSFTHSPPLWTASLRLDLHSVIALPVKNILIVIIIVAACPCYRKRRRLLRLSRVQPVTTASILHILHCGCCCCC